MRSRSHRRQSRTGAQGRFSAGLRPRLAVLGFGLVAAALLLEVLLQAASFVIWRSSRAVAADPARATTGERVVLCVGDSFTFGVGASSPTRSYPAQLEVALRARSPASCRWRVVNAGWPGRNSAEVLQRLPGQIDRERPDYVCVLVGANNAWNPAEMDLPPPVVGPGERAGEVGSGWVWRFRTGRLLRLAAVFLSGRPPAELAPDGPPPSTPTGGPTVDAPPTAGSGPVRPRTPIADPLSDEERRVADLDWTAAQEAIHTIWHGYARFQEGDPSGFDEVVEASRTRIAELRDPRVAAALVEALGYCGRDDQAVAVGLETLERYGFTAELFDHLSRPLARLGRMAEARSMAARALELRPHSARVHRTAAFLDGMDGRESAHVWLARAFALDGNRSTTLADLRLTLQRVWVSRARFLSLLDELDLEDDDRRALASVYDQAEDATESRQTARLRRDLLAMAELAGSRGARMVVLTYPKPHGRENSTIATILDVAADSGTPLIDLGPVFAELLRSRRSARLYVPDGHLSDEGYRLMADEVASRLIGLEGCGMGREARVPAGSPGP